MRIQIFIWGILSLVIAVYMAGSANRRIEQIIADENGDFLNFTKYVLNCKTVILLLIIFIISAYSGYVVSFKAVSNVAWIELIISYQILLSVMIIDYKLHIIPNQLSVLLIVSKGLLLMYELFFESFNSVSFIDGILGCVLCFLVLMGAGRIFPEGIGKGDIKLLSALGFLCGTYTVFSTLLLALFCCVIVSVILLFMKKVSIKDCLPFGPFIWMGYVCMILLAY